METFKKNEKVLVNGLKLGTYVGLLANFGDQILVQLDGTDSIIACGRMNVRSMEVDDAQARILESRAAELLKEAKSILDNARELRYLSGQSHYDVSYNVRSIVEDLSYDLDIKGSWNASGC